MKIDFSASFDKGYIGEPYWPEMAKFIDIQKQSGVNRARTQKNRDRALRTWLDGHDMTLQQYEQLQRDATRPFYLENGPGSAIVIPEHHVYGMMANACAEAPSSVRLCDPGQVRVLVRCGNWLTLRTKPDGTWARFAVVTGAQGKLSNQRSLRESQYIAKFSADGEMEFDPDTVDPKRLHQFLEWSGREIGIGAARKMGWGRFKIEEWN